MSTQEDHRDDAALAGEYALHLLDAAERAAFEKRMADDPVLRDLVRDWDDQLALLTQDVAPVTPPAHLKARLQQTLFPDHSQQRSGVWAWFAGGVTAAVLAAGILFVVSSMFDDVGPEPTLRATVEAEDGSLIVTARFIDETNTLEISRQIGAAVPGRALELWLIAEGADAPVSLGTLPEGREARIDVLPALAQQMRNAVLAISDEPAGGSPTGAPTGAVLAVGPVTDA